MSRDRGNARPRVLKRTERERGRSGGARAVRIHDILVITRCHSVSVCVYVRMYVYTPAYAERERERAQLRKLLRGAADRNHA